VFERFTDGARRSVVLAQDEARGLRHNYIGTEHLLLGILAEGEGLAAAVLGDAGVEAQAVRDALVRMVGRGPEGSFPADDATALGTLGIDLDAVRSHVEETFGRGALEGPPPRRRRRRFRRRSRCETYEAEPGCIPFTPRAKKVLELALRESVTLGHNGIGTEHVLLGLLRESEGLAAFVLAERVPLDDLRRQLLARIGKVA
jgi:ATP-dependent Clp protease ATP-binding subunit ClpA